MKLFQRFDKLKISRWLRLMKNATIEVELPYGGVNNVMHLAASELSALDTVNRPKILTAAATLLASESDRTVYLNSATGFIVTLPTAAAGLRFRIVCSTAPTSGSHTVVTAASANVMKGQVTSSDLNAASDGSFLVTGADTLTFVVNKALASDMFDIECDGTTWHCWGRCTVFDALTVTLAS